MDRASNIAKYANNKIDRPTEIYAEQFAASDPLILSARCGVQYDEVLQAFKLRALNRDVYVYWPSMKAKFVDGASYVEQDVPANLRILLGRLLLEGKLVPSSNKFITYSDIPWGQSYIKPFEGRCLKRFAFMFKNSEQFAKSAIAAGAIAVKDGKASSDACFDFEVVEKIWVRLSYWDADEEFPPSTQILFSDNIVFAFTAEDVANMGDILLNELKAHIRIDS